jgi:ubiquinol-cytochrome c reductase subunit 6
MGIFDSISSFLPFGTPLDAEAPNADADEDKSASASDGSEGSEEKGDEGKDESEGAEEEEEEEPEDPKPQLEEGKPWLDTQYVNYLLR